MGALDLMNNARIIPIQPANRVRSILKLANGDLEVTQTCGSVFVLKREDELFQAFVIYTALADL